MLLTSPGCVRKKGSCCAVPYMVCTPDTLTVLVGHGTTWPHVTPSLLQSVCVCSCEGQKLSLGVFLDLLRLYL